MVAYGTRLCKNHLADRQIKKKKREEMFLWIRTICKNRRRRRRSVGQSKRYRWLKRVLISAIDKCSIPNSEHVIGAVLLPPKLQLPKPTPAFSMLVGRPLLPFVRSKPSARLCLTSNLPISRLLGCGARTMSATAARPDPFRPAQRVAGQRQDVWYDSR